jgi:hypothetical protein
MPAVTPDDDRSRHIGSHGSGPDAAERGKDVRARMAIEIISPNGNYGERRLNRGKKFVRAAGGAPVMTNLEHVRAEIVECVIDEPALFGALRISHEKKPGRAVLYEDDCAGFVRIVERSGPSGVGSKETQQHTVYAHCVVCVNALPRDTVPLHGLERVEIHRASLRECSVAKEARMKRLHH